MKLRNKNTGEIGFINLKVYGDDAEYVYDKLETLYEDWEDNIPVEPLIKNDEFKEIFRAWSKLFATSSYKIRHFNNGKTTLFQGNNLIEQTIELPGCFGEESKTYTTEEIIGK